MHMQIPKPWNKGRIATIVRSGKFSGSVNGSETRMICGQGGVACYDAAIEEEIYRFFLKKLTKKIGNEKIFWWKSQENYDKVET